MVGSSKESKKEVRVFYRREKEVEAEKVRGWNIEQVTRNVKC